MTSDDPRRAKIAEIRAGLEPHGEYRLDNDLPVYDAANTLLGYVDELTAEIERLTAAQALSADLARRCILSEDESLAEDSIDLLKLIQPDALCGSTDHGRICEQLRGHGGMHRSVGGTWK